MFYPKTPLLPPLLRKLKSFMYKNYYLNHNNYLKLVKNNSKTTDSLSSAGIYKIRNEN